MMYDHKDALSALNSHLPLKEKLISAHQVIQQKFAFIERIAFTIYDPETRVLKTYLHSSGEDSPLNNYQALLDDAPSLKEILKQGHPRVVNKLVTFEKGEHEHSQRIGRQGYAASYTMPMFHNAEFIGFLFFNSYQQDVFTEQNLSEIDVYGHMLTLMVINELTTLKILSAAVKTTGHITHVRDPETGSHLDRMSRFSRVIASELANSHQLDDEYIEHIFMFAPLHDIGKIAIPDSILLKPGALTDDERKEMQTHPLLGREMIDDIINNFGLDSINQIDILQNIAAYHHEAVNGSGYPEGRSGNEIPLEARIIAVADVFDALTSKRPYKEAWSNDRAFETLKQMADKTLDRDCVDALIKHREMIEEIQKNYKEDYYG